MTKTDALQGSLDLLVLKLLSRRPRLHGYAIMAAIASSSGEVLRVEEGSLYPALYRIETNVLLTRFASRNCLLEVCDWMPVQNSMFGSCIIRTVRAMRGEVDVEMRCRPAFDYARGKHRARFGESGVLFEAEDEQHGAMRLLSNVALELHKGAAHARFHLQSGERAYFVFGALALSFRKTCKLSSMRIWSVRARTGGPGSGSRSTAAAGVKSYTARRWC